MEFYPPDLIKEYPEVELEPQKKAKPTTIKASDFIIYDAAQNFFKWN